MLQTYIVLRQSPNWGDISHSEFQRQSREFCTLMNRPTEQVNMSVDLWNRTFKRSFFSIRQEIKEVSLANFISVENAIIINTNETKTNIEPLEGFYIFIDDDDWLHPELAKFLSSHELDNQVGGLIWGSAVFGGPKNKIVQLRKLEDVCYTNNYAISGSYLKMNPEEYSAVFQHGNANTILKKSNAKVVNHYWSITNKNPTSTVYMEKILNGDFSSSRLIDAIEDYLKRCEKIDEDIDSSLLWAKPMMHKMIQIFSELF